MSKVETIILKQYNYIRKLSRKMVGNDYNGDDIVLELY